MALLDLLGRRWAMRIGWELRERPLAFGALREACGGISTSVLTQRLGELDRAGIVERRAADYALTDAGRELVELLMPLDSWAKRWAARKR
jgi:DNA-binding HxlR family transcriptional regulator